VLAALELARAAGAITLLNPAPANADVDAALLAAADIATPNESEFAALLSRHADEHVEANTVADLDDSTLHAFCRRLLPHGTAIVTLGAAGAFVSHGDDWRGDDVACLRIPAFPATAIDTTGAGDAFSGALAASLALVDGPFAEHVRFAARYAARSTECAGAAVSMPRLTPASAEPPL
jgi:ribokinase